MVEEKMQIDVSDEKNEIPAGNVDFRVAWPGKKDKFVRIELPGFQLSLPIDNFDFQFMGADLGASEKRMLERWLQQNLKVRLYSQQGKKVLIISWKRAA
jgi:hypothetical protein